MDGGWGGGGGGVEERRREKCRRRRHVLLNDPLACNFVIKAKTGLVLHNHSQP